MGILTSVRRLYIRFKSLVNVFVYSFGRAALLLLVEVKNHTVPARERRRIRVNIEKRVNRRRLLIYPLTCYNLLNTEHIRMFSDVRALPSYSLPTVTFRIYSVGSQLSRLSHTPVRRRHTISHTAIFSGTDPGYRPFQYMGLCPHR